MVGAQKLQDTDISINPTEVGLQSILTRRMLDRAPAGFMELAIMEHKNAWKEKNEPDLLGLFSGFSVVIGAAGSALILGEVGAGSMRLRGATEPGPKPHVLVLHPYHIWSVFGGVVPLTSGAVAAGGGGAVSDEVLRENFVTRLLGMDLFESALISIDSSDDGYGVAMSKAAIILIVTHEGDIDPEWNASLRGWELNFVGEYGYAEWTDSYGVALLGDLAVPTT